MSHWTANQQTDCFCAMEIRKPELSGVVLVFLSSFLGFYAGKGVIPLRMVYPFTKSHVGPALLDILVTSHLDQIHLGEYPF